MPGEDGFSLIRWLRGGGPVRAVPVLMLTARDAAGDRIEGFTLGADDYLAKPFEPQELVLRIEAILRRAGAPVCWCPAALARPLLVRRGAWRAGLRRGGGAP